MGVSEFFMLIWVCFILVVAITIGVSLAAATLFGAVTALGVLLEWLLQYAPKWVQDFADRF